MYLLCCVSVKYAGRENCHCGLFARIFGAWGYTEYRVDLSPYSMMRSSASVGRDPDHTPPPVFHYNPMKRSSMPRPA